MDIKKVPTAQLKRELKFHTSQAKCIAEEIVARSNEKKKATA